MTTEITTSLVEQFRATGGQVNGAFPNSRVLLLTTTSTQTGEPVTTPVAHLHDTEQRSLLVATPDETGTLPSWFADLCAEPLVTLETGTFVLQSRAEVTAGDERDELFTRLAEADPALAAAQERFGAPLPVIALNPVSRRPVVRPDWGNDLKIIHDGFRRELALVRREVAGAGRRLVAQLKINCLMMCGDLHHHHTMESVQIFPAVVGQHPELEDVVRKLHEQHDAMAVLLDDLRRVVSDEDADPAVVLSEVERLTVELEAHLDYEEEHLVPALSAMSPVSPPGSH